MKNKKLTPEQKGFVAGLRYALFEFAQLRTRADNYAKPFEAMGHFNEIYHNLEPYAYRPGKIDPKVIDSTIEKVDESLEYKVENRPMFNTRNDGFLEGKTSKEIEDIVKGADEMMEVYTCKLCGGGKEASSEDLCVTCIKSGLVLTSFKTASVHEKTLYALTNFILPEVFLGIKRGDSGEILLDIEKLSFDYASTIHDLIRIANDAGVTVKFKPM